MTRGRSTSSRKRKPGPSRAGARGLALLLLILILGAGAYWYWATSADRQVTRDLDRLADSLTARSGAQAGAFAAEKGREVPDNGKSVTVAAHAGREPSAPVQTAAPSRQKSRFAPQPAVLPEESGPLQTGVLPKEHTPSLFAGPSRGGADGSRPGPAALPLARNADSPSARNASPSVQDGSRPGPAVSSSGSDDSAIPLAGQTLEQVGAAFVRVYGDLRPKQWGERLPGVTWRLDPAGEGNAFHNERPAPPGEERIAPARTTPSGSGGRPTIALTLDACDGGKGASYDAGIIALLRENRIPATIFVTSIWMRNNPEALRDLAADPLFEIAAHGSRHKPCSVNGSSAYGIKGTASFDELVREVEGNVRDITRVTGKRPRWFRSGTAYYDDVAVRVIRDLNLGLAGYSVAGDQGASLPAARVASRTLAAKDGDILLYHLNHPRSGTREGLERSLPALLEKGCVFVRLSPE